MKRELERVDKILKKEYGKLRKMYIGTSNDDIPKAKLVNVYYKDGSFFLVIEDTSQLKACIHNNKQVSLCSTASFHKVQGIVEVEHLRVDESGMIHYPIRMTKVFTYANKIGYNVDFTLDEVESFRFAPNG